MATRRNFVLAGLASTVIAWVKPLSANTTDLFLSNIKDQRKINKASMNELIGSRFRILDHNRQGGNFILDKILDGPQASGLEQFSALFVADQSKVLDTGLFHVSNKRFGHFLLHLEPVQTGAATFEMKAVFAHFQS